MSLVIRPLRGDDVERLDAVLRRAYGFAGSFEPRLRRYIGDDGIASFVADDGGDVLGCSFATNYAIIAYVGLMGVDPERQHGGIGSALLNAVFAWAEERRIGSLQLDATPAGAPLYRAMGFEDDGDTIVFGGVPRGGDASPDIRVAAPADRQAILAADRHAFGANRAAVLEKLFAEHPKRLFVAPDGSYALAQQDSIGPVIASDASVAGALIDRAAAHFDGRAVRIDVPGQNPDAVALCGARQLTERRRVRHMVRGARVRSAVDRVFARINLGEG